MKKALPNEPKQSATHTLFLWFHQELREEFSKRLTRACIVFFVLASAFVDQFLLFGLPTFHYVSLAQKNTTRPRNVAPTQCDGRRRDGDRPVLYA